VSRIKQRSNGQRAWSAAHVSFARQRARLRRVRVRTPQQARSKRTRADILKAAIWCFEHRGYDETTTLAIARRAGIAVGTLYGYFPDKRAILLELLDEHTEHIAELVVQRLKPELWIGADLRNSVRQLISTLFHSRTIQPGMQRILWERYFKDPEFRKAVEAIEQRVKAAMLELFAALAREGALRITDLSTAAFIIHAAVEWTTSRIMLGEAEVDLDATVDALADMISRYLFSSPEEAAQSSASELPPPASAKPAHTEREEKP
jgi:AcrR family transcriptional regulator